MAIQVYYNNNLVGSPFISKSFAPLDYGNRWGMTESITLNGYIDPIDGVQTQIKQDHLGANFTEKTTGEAVDFTDIFKQNFKALQVYDDNVLVEEYDIPSCLVEEVSFAQSKWAQKTPVKYTVKLKAYDVYYVDAVVDPSDSWQYSDNEDGSVSVTHKVSAKGIKSGTLSAFERARVFVDKYKSDSIGVWPGPSIAGGVSTGLKVPMLSRSENVNRMEGTYSITESFKYYTDDENQDQCPDCVSDAWVTADNGAYASEDECRAAYNCSPAAQAHILKTMKMVQNNSLTEDFATVDYDIEYQGAVNDVDISNLRARLNAEMTAGNYTFEKHIASELLPATAPAAINSNYIYVYQNNMSISEDEAGHKLTVKAQYQTGYDNLTNGFLDWKVDLSRDEVTDIATYQINGEFISYGNVNAKREKAKNFKDTYYDNSTNNIQSYLYALVSSGQVFKSWGNGPCSPCDDDDWQTDANNPAEFTTLLGCREFYGCTQRGISPYPRTIKWSENINLGTLNVSAEFSDEDYSPQVANLKWSVSETNTKHIMKEQASANVDGVFALQDLNCKLAQNTKITVNGERQHVVGGDTAFSTPPNYTSQDHVAHAAVRLVADQVAALAVPKDAKAYGKDNLNFARELIDESDDATYPYSFAANRSYLHTPTSDNSELLALIHVHGPMLTNQNQGNTEFERGKGYKFGY